MKLKKFIACAAACAVAACGAFALFGCAQESGQDATGAQDAAKMRIGTMQTEDALPFWVAEAQDDYAEAGVEVEIVTFQSAQEPFCRVCCR